MVGSRDKNARKQTDKESTEFGTGTEVKMWTVAHNMERQPYKRRSTYGHQLSWEDMVDN